MDLNIYTLVGLRYHFFSTHPPYQYKVNFHGHDTLPLHGKTHSAIDEQAETGPKKTPPTTHLNVRWRKKDQR
jgi:hypothetical protein